MTGVVLFVLWVAVCLTGTLICRIEKEKETGKMKYLTGFFFLLCCQGVVFTAGQMLGLSFSKTAVILAGVLGTAMLVSLLFCGRHLAGQIKAFLPSEKTDRAGWAVWLLMICLGLRIAGAEIAAGSDAVAETVQTTLLTDTMNVFHPLTGQELELGLITSKKILTLPFLYSFFSCFSGQLPVSQLLPLAGAVTAVLSLAAVYELARILFRGNRTRVRQMMLLLLLLLLSGDYMAGAEGYRMLHQGYRGEVIISAVGIPYLLLVLYRLLGRYLERDFEQEKYGLSLRAALIYLGVLFGGSLFVAPPATGWLPMLLSGGAFFAALFASCLYRRLRIKGFLKETQAGDHTKNQR